MDIIAQYLSAHGDFALRIGILLVIGLGCLAWASVGISKSE